MNNKEILFTTEDNVSIFEGDFAYEVKRRGKILKKPLKWVCSKMHLPYLKKSKSLNFSTEDAAEKYIRENKPQYSLKEIETAISKSLLIYSKPFVDKIIITLENGRNLE